MQLLPLFFLSVLLLSILLFSNMLFTMRYFSMLLLCIFQFSMLLVFMLQGSLIWLLGKVLKKKYKKVDRRFTLLNPPSPLQKVDRMYFFLFTMKKSFVKKKCLRRAKIIFSKSGKDLNSH